MSLLALDDCMHPLHSRGQKNKLTCIYTTYFSTEPHFLVTSCYAHQCSSRGPSSSQETRTESAVRGTSRIPAPGFGTLSSVLTNRPTDRRTDPRTDGETHGQTDTPTDRRTDLCVAPRNSSRPSVVTRRARSKGFTIKSRDIHNNPALVGTVALVCGPE